jgi:type II secretory pathway component PulF
MSSRIGQLSAEQAALLAAQVAELSKAGLPLDGGLRALADELPRGRLANVLRDMAGQLSAGTPLDAVLQSQAARLPPHVHGLMLGALRNGRLPEVLDEFAEIERNRIELHQRVWVCLAYPIVLFVLLGGVYLLLAGYVAVQFNKIYRDFDARLPFMTQLFLNISGSRAWYIVGCLLLTIGLCGLILKIPGISWPQRLFYMMPVIGPLVRWSRLTRFARLMGLLLEQGIPLPEALRLAAAGLSDAYLAAGCRAAAAEVEAGRPLSESLATHRQFPPSMIPIMEWGQNAVALPDAFRSAAEAFEGRAGNQANFMEAALLPLTFLIVVAFVGSFIIGLFMPMINLIQKMSG